MVHSESNGSVESRSEARDAADRGCAPSGAACGSSATSAPAASSAAAPPPRLAVRAPPRRPRAAPCLRRLGADVTTWDPCQLASTTPGTRVDPLAAMYGLLVYTDVHGVVQPGMAQSLTTTDGMTCDAQAAARSGSSPMARRTTQRPSSTTGIASPILRMPVKSQKWVSTFTTTVVDPQTLSIKLASVDNNFALKVAELIPLIASPAALKAAATPTDIKPVGLGRSLCPAGIRACRTCSTATPGTGTSRGRTSIRSF